jgi:hypothetical protein
MPEAPMRKLKSWLRVAIRSAVLAALLGAATHHASAAQGLPGPVYHELQADGHPDLARKLSKMLDVRSHPDSADVQHVLDRWAREAGGPDSGYDYLAVTRLWLKAGQAAEAELALRRTEGAVPAGLMLLDQARVAFLAREYAVANLAYWKGCEIADQAAAIEYWLDIESLATPEEVDQWERFATLPAHERDLCWLLRGFWNERAAASAVTVSRRLAQHYERLRFVRQRYLRRTGKKGPSFSNRVGRPTNSILDDRGLLYLRMGEPHRKTSYLNGDCYQSNESWAYYYPEETHIYHLTSGAGVDDWWMIDNLQDVYICGNPNGFGRGALSPLNTVGVDVPGAGLRPVLNELYASRGGLDSRYQQMAFRMKPGNPVSFQEQFGRERNWTYRDAEFAVDSVPERPALNPKARLMVEDLQFRSRTVGKTRVWLNGLIEAKELSGYTMSDGSLRYELEAVYSLIDSRDQLIQGRQLFETLAEEKLGEDESIPIRILLTLPPGRYRYTLMVRSTHRERGKDPIGNYRRGVLTVHEYDATVPQLSSVAVAPDSGGDWTAGGRIYIKPSPAHNTGPDRVAYIYYEAYGLTPGGEYVTTVHMDPAGFGEDFTLEFRRLAGPSPAEPTRGYLRLDLRKTPPGRYKMDVVVTDASTALATLPLPLEVIVNE